VILPAGEFLQILSEILLVRILVVRKLAYWELHKRKKADHVLKKKISLESFDHFSSILGALLLLVVFDHLIELLSATPARKMVLDHILFELRAVVNTLIEKHFRKDVIDHLLEVSFVFIFAIFPGVLEIFLRQHVLDDLGDLCVVL